MVVLVLAVLAFVPAAMAADDHARTAAVKTRTWVSGVPVTEYWPVPEAWFIGKAVRAPGLAGPARIDWLYSGRGMSMEGDGIGLDGRLSPERIARVIACRRRNRWLMTSRRRSIYR